jgi:hypothetical protein
MGNVQILRAQYERGLLTKDQFVLEVVQSSGYAKDCTLEVALQALRKQFRRGLIMKHELISEIVSMSMYQLDVLLAMPLDDDEKQELGALLRISKEEWTL